MILGIEDKSGKNIAFNVDSIVAVAGDPADPERCYLHLAHVDGVAFNIHFTVAEFMSRVGEAVQAVNGRATLLGMHQTRKQ